MAQSPILGRRRFLRRTALSVAGAAFAAPAILRGSAEDSLRAGVMGLGRGMAHVQSLLRLKGVDVAYVCDVDSRRLETDMGSGHRIRAIPPADAQRRRAPVGVVADDFTKSLMSLHHTFPIATGS